MMLQKTRTKIKGDDSLKSAWGIPQILQGGELLSFHATRICQSWRDSVEAIFETGHRIIEAKQELPHGEFLLTVKEKLPFTERAAQMLMAIASDRRLANTNHGSLLPSSCRTLYELTKLDDDAWAAALDSGAICLEMQRQDVAEKPLGTETQADREKNLGSSGVETI